MSGGYAASVGERMKGTQKPKTGAKVDRAPIWIRFRYSWTAGGRSREKRGPWVYCYWEKNLGLIPRFVRGAIGSWNQVERLEKGRPGHIATMPYAQSQGVDLFMEKL